VSQQSICKVMKTFALLFLSSFASSIAPLYVLSSTSPSFSLAQRGSPETISIPTPPKKNCSLEGRTYQEGDVTDDGKKICSGGKWVKT
jgi:hypothetical protein